MIFYKNFTDAIEALGRNLIERGHHLKANFWQSKDISESPMTDMWELLDVSFRVIGNTDDLKQDIKPNLPWADVHFKERVGGLPLNPPPSNEIWPFAQQSNKEFQKESLFDHTYPERFWPKWAGFRPKITDKPQAGVRFTYGDLSSVINLLKKDPNTRQAYLPIFFPEDTGSEEGQRVPCTLGYLFVIRNGFLHITYYMRSCDYLRHFRDDIYLAVLLQEFVVKRISNVSMGAFNMHIANLHCFVADKAIISKRLKQ